MSPLFIGIAAVQGGNAHVRGVSGYVAIAGVVFDLACCVLDETVILGDIFRHHGLHKLAASGRGNQTVETVENVFVDKVEGAL